MSKRLFSAVFAALLVCALPFSAAALEVDQQELESVSAADTIVFVNYTGPHAVIDSVDQIKGIGSSLGNVIASDPAAAEAGLSSRYYVIHAVDPNIAAGLDADILILGENATVDHIRNLRRIIAAYLSSAYGYTEKDAETLAVFITVYNAVYRGDTASFSAKYKPAVTKHLSAEKAGLALNYQDWPGKSQIVIPLANPAGGLGTVDTTIISDKQVVQSMREEEDKGVDVRKDMVDIKEREADVAAEQAADAQKQAAQAAVKQKEEEQKQTQAVKEAETAQKQAETAQKEAAANPDDAQAQQRAAETAAEAETKRQAAEAQTAKAEEQKQIAEEKRTTAAEQQAAADKKREEARTDRTEIAKDQQQLIAETAEPPVNAAYGLKMLDDTFSVMVKLNAATGQVIRQSPVTVVRGRTLLPAGENYMAVAGQTGGNAAVKLVLLDTVNMEIVAESKEQAAEKSVLIRDGNDFYAVVQDQTGWIVGKYDAALSLTLKSKITVHPATPIVVTDAGICVTDTAGNAKLLKKTDLTEVK